MPKLVTRLVFPAVLALLVSGTASAADSAQVEDSGLETFIQAEKAKTAAQLGVPEEDAESFIRTLAAATIAREAAAKDETGVTALYADTLQQYAEALVLSKSVLIRGQALFEEIKSGTPGTKIPQPLAEKINAWAWSAGNTLVMMAKAGGTAGKWAEQRFLAAGVCDVDDPRLNFTKCETLANETLALWSQINNHFESMADAIQVLVLTVPNMTY